MSSKQAGRWLCALWALCGVAPCGVARGQEPAAQSTLSRPETGKIVFVSNRARHNDLWVMNADGSNTTRLTRTSSNEAEPSLSFDRTRIAFTLYPPGSEYDYSQAEIYTMHADGSRLRRLTHNTFQDSNPAWSPDGRRIVFESERGDNLDLYLINADGSGLRRLTNHRGNDSSPSWSRDGSRIVFASSRDTRPDPQSSEPVTSQIYSIRPDGSGLQRLTRSASSKNHPRFSPDGNLIAFDASAHSRRVGTQVAQLYIMRADGSGGRVFAWNETSDPVGFTHPAWSPDGQTLCYGTDGQEGELYLSGLDRKQRRLTFNTIYDGEPSWGPGRVPDPPKRAAPTGGGGKIAFVCLAPDNRQSIGTVQPDGRDYRRFARTTIEKGQYLLSGSGLDYSGFGGFSPDERHIVLSREEWKYEDDSYVINSGLTDLHLLRPDGSLRRLTRTRRDFAPVFSPDGRRILFQRAGDEWGEKQDTGLYVMNADGSKPRRLGLNTLGGHSFVWSPDGRKLAFVASASGVPQIWLMEVASGKAVRLPNGEEFFENSPRFSPDGRYIVYEAHTNYIQEESSHRSSIRIARADGTRDRALLQGEFANTMPAWSPDNHRIAFVSERGDGPQIYTVRTDGSDLFQVTHGPNFHMRPEFRPVFSRRSVPMPRPAHSSAHNKIAWSTTRSSLTGRSIYLMNPDTRGLSQVIGFHSVGYSSSCQEPAISPDGRRIAFRLAVSGRDSSNQYIVVADVAGSRHTEPWYGGDPNDPNAIDRRARPTWSADGRFIAFDGHQGEVRGRYSNYRRPASDREIYIMRSDGRGQRALTRNTAQDFDAAWHPRRNIIAFVSDRAGNNELWLMDNNGRHLRRLTHSPADDRQPAWSPDGCRLAWSSRHPNGDFEIWSMNADGTNRRRLTSRKGNDTYPAWSADGTRIIWQARHGETTLLRIMNADGTGQSTLSDDGGFDGHPAWGRLPATPRAAQSTLRRYPKRAE